MYCVSSEADVLLIIGIETALYAMHSDAIQIPWPSA